MRRLWHRKNSVRPCADSLQSKLRQTLSPRHFPMKFQIEALVLKQCDPLFNSFRSVYNRAWKKAKTKPEELQDESEEKVKEMIQKINRLFVKNKKKISWMFLKKLQHLELYC